MTSASDRPAMSVVVPVYNARDCLAELVDRLARSLREADFDAELILLDDASTDGSYEELERIRSSTHPQLRIERNPENIGQVATIVRGLGVARGKVTVVMDCDLQDEPEKIPLLARRLESAQADAVIVRYANYANGGLRFLLSRGHALARRLRGKRNNDPRLAAFRAFGEPLRDHVLRSYVKGRLLRDMFHDAPWKIEYVDATRARRHSGRSSYSLWTLLKLGLGRR